MVRQEIRFPRRIVAASENVTQTEWVTRELPLQLPIGDPESAGVNLPGGAYIILDFGEELRGRLRLLCRTVLRHGKWADIRLHVRFGESVGECCAPLGERGAGNDHSPRDFEIPLASMSDTTWGQSGFRFVRLDVPKDPDLVVTFRSIVAVEDVLDLPLRYTYRGTDPLVGDIFRVAKHTIDMCAAGDYVWDGVKRDRLVWIGDMHPEMLALTTLYGRTPMMENSIVFLKDTTAPDQWMCGIATYSAWWVIVLSDYVTRTGAEEFARPLVDYAAGIVRRFLSLVTEEGEITQKDRVLVDWPTHEQPDEPAGVRAILLYMANRAVTLFDRLGAPSAEAAELAARLRRRPITVTHAMQVAGLKYMATGELPPEDVALLGRLGARGMSTFMSYYILTAYARYFGKDAALAVMKEYYGGMLSRGATTFWEDFDLAWLDGSGRIDEMPDPALRDLHGDYGKFCYIGYRHSFCHAWSTGILAFLAENGF